MKKMLLATLALLFVTGTSVFAQQTIGLNAEADYPISPADYGLTFEEIHVETPDKKEDNTNLMLFGWHLIPNDKTSRKAMIIAHNGQGNMSYALENAGIFLGMGYHVFMFDYRGYGQSDAFNVSPKFYIYAQFATDLNAMVDYVKKYHTVMTCSIYGYGIGGGLALGVGASNIKTYSVIADAPYITLESIEKTYKEMTGQKIFMPLAYDKAMIEPGNALPVKGDHLRGIMLICGANGDLIKAADVAALANYHKKVTTVYTVPGVNNDMNFESNKDEYYKQVKSFLDGLD